jgi:hypothetical protein
MHHPGRTASRASHEIAERPKSVIGAVLLLLGIAGLIWAWPEIQRYLKIERM